MTFVWPFLLWLLLLPLALLGWDWLRGNRAQRDAGHEKILRAEAGKSRVSLEAAPRNAAKRRLPRLWLAAGLALSVVALARPQWGRVVEQVFEQSREILLALDLSRSMNAPDVKPSRIERAKLLVQALLDRLAGERVGLVVFSGTAFLQSPLSSDYEILREFLPDLKPGYMPDEGTDFESLLKTAAESFSSTAGTDRFLIILSDGETHDEAWKSALEALREKKVRVIALGVGTQGGAMIPDPAGGFVKDSRGAVVMSHLTPDTLREIAAETKGVYCDASTWVDLATVLRQTVEAGRAGDFTEKRAARKIERYQWALGPALFCLFASLLFEFPIRIKPRAIGAPVKASAKVPPVIAALALLLGLVSLAPDSARAAESQQPPQDTPLVATVRRLSAKGSLRALDCADMAKRTLEWGQGLQSQQQPIPDGPIRDGLEAVNLGEAQDKKAADWPGLRRDLEALRKKQDQQKKDEQKDQQQQQQDQQRQDQKDSQQQEQKDQQQQNQQQNQPQKQDQPKQQPQQKESAFGKPPPENRQEQQKPRPQPAQDDMQKVGGRDRKQEMGKGDPSLTAPLEKLEKLKDNDSPGMLFQLMQDEKKPEQPSNKQNW